MSLLTACQSAVARLAGRKTTTIFSSKNRLEIELADLCNEVAVDIAKSNDWQALVRIHTLTGDGVATAFPLPTDYARMLIDADMIDANSFVWGYTRILDLNDWIWLNARGIQALPGNWILFGNEFQFIPAPSNGAEAQFPYISKDIVVPSEGTDQTKFNNDADTFVLDERLLTLGLVWKWREQKRIDASADQANFQKAFAEIAGRDKGSRILRVGKGRFPANTTVAYPFNLGS